jgi:hypothetical protein
MGNSFAPVEVTGSARVFDGRDDVGGSSMLMS